MRKFHILSIAMLLISMNLFAQTQSIVIQKNTVPDADKVFTFSTTSPTGSSIDPLVTLNNVGTYFQAGDIGASSGGSTGYLVMEQPNNSNAVYSYTSGASGWNYQSYNAIRVDQKTDGVIYAKRGNEFWAGATNTTWWIKDVGVGPDDIAWVCTDAGEVHKYSGGVFTYIWGASSSVDAYRIDGGPGGTAWWIASNGHIYQYNGSAVEDRGTLPAGPLVDIAVGADGNAWVIAHTPATTANYNTLYKWNGTAFVADAYAPTGTNIQNVTVGLDNEPLITLNFNNGPNYLLKRLSDGKWIKVNPQDPGKCDTRIYYNQPTGTYSFTEQAEAGYYIQQIAIFGSIGDSYNINTGVSNISLSSDEHIYISYTNVNGTRPAATDIGSACGAGYVENFGTGSDGTYAALPIGVTTYAVETNPQGTYIGNGVNDGEYVLSNSVYDAYGYYYQWISGPGAIPNNTSAPTNSVHDGTVRNATDYDHTVDAAGENGRMLLVNAELTSGIIYQKEYTGLVTNKKYQFSIWLANILLSSAADATNPNVILRVVDPSTGSILLNISTGDIAKSSSNTLDWHQFIGSFTATSSNVIVYIINNKPGGQGNDLAIDDIGFNVDCHAISGSVFNDNDALNDNAVDGELITTILTTSTSPVYAILISNNTVVASQQITNGTYNFSNLYGGSYKVIITSSAPPANGDAAPSATFYTGWQVVGNALGTNNGSAIGNIPSPSAGLVIDVLLGTSDVANVDFGLNLPPDADNKQNVAIEGNNMTSPVSLSVDNAAGFTENYGSGQELTGSDVNAGTIASYTIASLPLYGNLYLNGTLVTSLSQVANLTAAQLSQLSYQTDPSKPNANGQTSDQFTYYVTDNAGLNSTPATYIIPFLTALPVSLKQFNLEVSDCAVLLKWQVASELDLQHYQIEVSVDGFNFAKVVAIPASGISVYQYKISGIENGQYYYRIKMLDIDGKFTYSPILKVKLECLNTIPYVASTVVKSMLTVKGLKKGDAVVVYSSTQRVLVHYAENEQSEINISYLNAGLYFVSVQREKTLLMTAKIIKQ